MSDMNFGVNLLPVSNKSNSLGSSSKKWDDIYVDKINGQSPTDVDALSSAMAIIVNGNTVPATIAEGQYVYIKNSTVLSDGLYKTITTVPSETVITAQTASTYFTAVSGGLGSEVASLNINLGTKFTVISGSSNIIIDTQKCIHLKDAKMVWIKFTIASSSASSYIFYGFPNVTENTCMIPIYKRSATDTAIYSMRIDPGGSASANGTIPVGSYIAVGFYM